MSAPGIYRRRRQAFAAEGARLAAMRAAATAPGQKFEGQKSEGWNLSASDSPASAPLTSNRCPKCGRAFAGRAVPWFHKRKCHGDAC